VTDDDLRQGLARDVDAAFEPLVRAYQDRLYLFALRYCACPPDAEEIVQDAFVRAYRALAAYPREQRATLQVKAWLFQITLNVARNRARRARPRTVPLDGADDDGVLRLDPADDPRNGPEPLVEAAERGRELGALIAALPERYRAPVILRHVNELSYDEVAALLGQPVGTVKSNVHRGVRLLRQQWP
jgi:RNA polymerase sigma-70 factor (ECF subfamily)